MKTIELKSTVEKVHFNGTVQEVAVSTLECIKTAINNVPEQGFTPSDMLNRIRLLDKIESLSPEATSLSLEEVEYNYLRSYVSSVRWGFLSRSILEFIQTFA